MQKERISLFMPPPWVDKVDVIKAFQLFNYGLCGVLAKEKTESFLQLIIVRQTHDFMN